MFLGKAIYVLGPLQVGVKLDLIGSDSLAHFKVWPSENVVLGGDNRVYLYGYTPTTAFGRDDCLTVKDVIDRLSDLPEAGELRVG
jgi:hypothetical protein